MAGRSILSRLHDFNCEWLQRPNIALSEMAQTLRENFPILAAQTPGVLDADFVESILVHFWPLTAILSRLDNKDKSTSEPATREDVVQLMKTITGEPDLEDRLREGLNAAGALFMTCVHLLVPLTLMRNPLEFADKARRAPANQIFKEDSSARRMRDFVLDSVTKKRRPVPGTSIWEVLDEEEEDSQPTTSSRRARSLPSAWEEEEADSSQPPARSRAADWTSAPPSRRGKRPAPGPLTSTPVNKPAKKCRVAAPLSSSSSSSSSEDSGEEESRPLSSAKAAKPAKASVPRAPPGKSPGTESGSKASSKKTKKAVSSSSSSSLSSLESSDEEDKRSKAKASKSVKESAAQSKKACQQTGKAPTAATAKEKGKVDSKAKEAAKKKEKSAASKTPDDDVWGQLAAATKKK